MIDRVANVLVDWLLVHPYLFVMRRVCFSKGHDWVVSSYDSRWYECSRCQKVGARTQAGRVRQ